MGGAGLINHYKLIQSCSYSWRQSLTLDTHKLRIMGPSLAFTRKHNTMSDFKKCILSFSWKVYIQLLLSEDFFVTMIQLPCSMLPIYLFNGMWWHKTNLGHCDQHCNRSQHKAKGTSLEESAQLGAQKSVPERDRKIMHSCRKILKKFHVEEEGEQERESEKVQWVGTYIYINPSG